MIKFECVYGDSPLAMVGLLSPAENVVFEKLYKYAIPSKNKYTSHGFTTNWIEIELVCISLFINIYW